jgi:hypothetical protein
MPRNEARVLIQLCPGIRIHAIDNVQPPGIGMPPVADMDPHHASVSPAQRMKGSAKTPTKASSETCSASRASVGLEILASKLFAREVV